VAAVTIAACDRRPINASAALPVLGAVMPTFVLPTHGSPDSVRTSDLAGAPAVVALWSTHCPYQGPWVQAFETLARTYGPRGVRIVVLADDAPGRALDSALARASWRSAVSLIGVADGELPALFDRSRTAPERERERVELVLPSFLLIDPAGRVVRRAFGPMPDFAPAIDSMLRAAPPEGRPAAS
jgi:Redoxin